MPSVHFVTKGSVDARAAIRARPSHSSHSGFPLPAPAAASGPDPARGDGPLIRRLKASEARPLLAPLGIGLRGPSAARIRQAERRRAAGTPRASIEVAGRAGRRHAGRKSDGAESPGPAQASPSHERRSFVTKDLFFEKNLQQNKNVIDF